MRIGKRIFAIAVVFLLAGAARAEIAASGWTSGAAVRFDARTSLGGRIVHGVETLGEPDGSASAPWDTTALEDGWHEVSCAGTETCRMLAINSPSIAVEGGRLQSDATWDASATHLVRHWVVVPSGKTLTLERGTVVKLCPDAGIRVEDGGSLAILGADGEEVIFTTADDETVGAAIDCGDYAAQSVGGGGVLLQSSAAIYADNTHVRFTFSSAIFPTLSIQDASAKRSDGVARIPVTVSGTARTTAFRVDWEASDGSAVFGEDYLAASGTLAWSKSADGTKYIEIPLDTETLRGSNTSFRVALTLHYACNVSRASADVVVREFDFPGLVCSEWTGSASVRYDGREGLAGAVAHGVETLGEPDGSASAPWDTTALADGWHEMQSTAIEGEEEPSTAAVLVVNSPSIAVEGGRLQSNASWTSAQTHLVRHTVVVPNGKTLTVGQDAVVKFLPGTGIKVEDGGKLAVVGAKGHDAIFTTANDETAGSAIDCGAYAAQSMAFAGIQLQSSAATFTDNSYIQTRGFNYAAYPYVRLNDTVAFRDGGMAYVPVTIASGTRNQAFSIDWVAVDGTARFGEDYTLASGTIEWTGTSQGTKTLQIPIAADNVRGETTSFKLRIAVSRACNVYGEGECTVTIRELDTLPLRAAAASGAPVRFDARTSLGGRIVHGVETLGEPDGSSAAPWDTTALEDGWREVSCAGTETCRMLAINAPSIAVEGGRLAADATWTSAQTHLVRHWVVVPSGKTLTLERGTVVKLCPDAGIKVEDGGSVAILGADGEDVIFTTADDDTAGAAIDCGAFAAQSMGSGGIRLQSSAAIWADNGWFQMRGVTCNASCIGQVAIHAAAASRKAGMAYVGVTVGGNTRNQRFTVDWDAVPGTAVLGRDYTLASGRLTWGKSGEGTKWIAIPLNKKTETDERRTFTVRLKTVRGMNGTGGEATVEIREYEEGALDAAEVAFFPEGEGSAPFAIDEPVWKEPMFRHDEEPIRLSGAWQGVAEPEDTLVRLSWTGDNGGGVLAEAPGGELATYTWRAADWDVGSYVLRHDILDAETGRRLAGYEKTFAVPSWEGVELHGGTLTSNETWRAGVVHVVYETVRVPALYTILLEPGAIVKFLTGTGITIEAGGGALFANGVVFTHINDDTVGGDTLNDGASLAPVMDAYTFSGALTIGEESELRFKTQAPLSGTISSSRKLTRGSTYRVSGNVTIASGATLTIPAGTVLKFDQGVQMAVNSGGTLLANGTRAAPVVFTSIKDDEWGGDTNGDGDATWPQGGDWQGLWIYGKADLANARLMYAGASNERGIVQTSGSGALTMDGCVLAHATFDGVWNWGGTICATNCVITDVGLAAAPYRGSANEYVNCVFHGCNDALMYWSHWTGKPVFENCVFSDMGIDWCNNASSSASGVIPSGVTTRNCVFWDSTGRLAVPARIGSDGNVWGDPCFRDADGGDFRILEGSVCIDAADSAAAPALDAFGQKRWTWATAESGAGAAADCGIAECVPRGAASDIDLVPVSIACNAAEAKPGQTLFFHWSTANEGGEDVETDWWDEIALVAAGSGRITVLGEKNQGNGISAGGTTTGTGYFEIPALADGVYGIRLKVNSRRDVPEGTRTDNNVLVAEEALAIAVDGASAAEGAYGMMPAGGTVVRRFDLGADGAATLVRVRASAGATVRWSFGNAPLAGSCDGEAVVSSTGETLFAVPAGTETLYVALEGGEEAGAFGIVFEDGSLAVAAVSPASVPRTGRVTLRIDGAGFGEDAALAFLAPSGASVAPAALVRESGETLWATVDCAALAAAGTRFAARVESGDAAATLPGALAVTGQEGRGQLWARLDLPAAARRGNTVKGRILYGNDGTADLPCPVFQLTSPAGGTLLALERSGASFASELTLVGLGNTWPRGVLRPGESGQAAFFYRVEGEYEITLSVVDGNSTARRESVFPTWAATLEAVAQAATRLNTSSREVRDWETLLLNAVRAGYGKHADAVSGSLRNLNTGLPIAGVRLSLCDGDGTPAAVQETAEDGTFLFGELPAGSVWTILSDDCQILSGGAAAVAGKVGGESLYAVPLASVACRVDVPEGVCDDGATWSVSAVSAAGTTIEAVRGEDGAYRLDGLRDGEWTVQARATDGWLCATNAPAFVVASGVATPAAVSIPVVRGGRVRAALTDEATGEALPARNVGLVGEDGFFAEGTSDGDGIALFTVPAGEYALVGGHGWTSAEETTAAVADGEETSIALPMCEVPFSVFPSAGPAPLACVFRAMSDERFAEGCTYEWDFDGDGTVESRDASPTHAYAASGTYAVALTVRNPDGTAFSFRHPRAVEVWEPVETEYQDGTLLLDERSGWEIVAASEGELLLARSQSIVATALAEGMILLVPGEETTPRTVLAIEELGDGGVAVSTAAAEITRAYRAFQSLAVASLPASAASSADMCHVQWAGLPFHKDWDAISLDSGLDSGLRAMFAIEIMDEKVQNVYFGVNGEVTTTFKIDTLAPEIAKNLGKIPLGPPVNFFVGPVPCQVEGKLSVDVIGSAALRVEIPVRTYVNYGWSWRRDAKWSLHPERKADLLNKPLDEMSWAFNGSVELSGKLSVEGAVGAWRDAGGATYGAKLLSTELSVGPVLNLSATKSTSEFVADEYGFSADLQAGITFAPLAVEIGEWFSFSPVKASLSSEPWNFFDARVQTPRPTVEITRSDNADGSVAVSMRGTTNPGEDWAIVSHRWEIDDGTAFVDGDCPVHVFPAVASGDEVTHTITMHEGYKLDKRFLPSLPAVKAVKKTLVVHAKRQDPLPTDEMQCFVGDIPESIDPNEVVGPEGAGDPETERFVKPGEWLDYTIYFENATNATAAAVQVRVTEELSPYLDWDSLELGEVVFANQADSGLSGLHVGTSEYAVPGTNYNVRTTFTLRNGIATWHLRMVAAEDEADEDGWPLDPYAGFLPPNDESHVGEGYVSYRVKVRDDAPKNVSIDAAADIVFDWNETIPTDPSWWNTVGHLPVALAFEKNCDDIVLGMPTNGDYRCDAPAFASPQREGWLFLGWADESGVARNCGADLPYDTAALDLFAQWREEVETRFATIAVDGGVLIAGLADGQACPAALVIPATVEVAGRRVKVVGVADDAFKGKRAIESLVVAEGIRTIGARSFMNCTALASVSLPSTIESIGENAFYGCRLLSSLTLAAETPPALGSGAFRSVASAGVLMVPTGSEAAYGGWIGSDLGSAWEVEGYDPDEPVEPGEPEWTVIPEQNLLLLAAGASDIRWAIEVEIDADGGLTLIQATGSADAEDPLVLPDPAFDAEGREYRIVAIGANEDILEAGIFEGLELASVTIPETVEAIAPCAFALCASLESVVFAGDAPALREIGEGAFFGCTSLAEADISRLSSLETLGAADDLIGVFESCWSLPEVTIPGGLGEIGAYAFQDCSRLRAVAFGAEAAVRTIGKRAFYNCDLIEDFRWKSLSGLERVGDAAFGGDTASTAAKFRAVFLPERTEELGAAAFLNDAALVELTSLAAVPPAFASDTFCGLPRTGVLRVPEASLEDYTNETARAWVGTAADKLPPWNGATGWQVKAYDPLDELTETQSSEVPVPYAWLRDWYPDLADESSAYETAANATAANRVNKVWECYLAGLDPTDEDARFFARIEIVGGVVRITHDPPLSAEEEASRTYRIFAKQSLAAPEPWTEVTDLPDLAADGYRFFRVKVEMK